LPAISCFPTPPSSERLNTIKLFQKFIHLWHYVAINIYIYIYILDILEVLYLFLSWIDALPWIGGQNNMGRSGFGHNFFCTSNSQSMLRYPRRNSIYKKVTWIWFLFIVI
jgi:hypothetical protein